MARARSISSRYSSSISSGVGSMSRLPNGVCIVPARPSLSTPAGLQASSTIGQGRQSAGRRARGWNMATSDLVVALTGASGAPYGVRLLEVLLRAGRTVHLSVSPAAVEVMERELGRSLQLDAFDPDHLFGDAFPGGDLHYHHFRDF